MTDVEVTKSDPSTFFDLAAIHAVYNWHYCPRADSTRSRVRLAFELDSSPPQGCDRYPAEARLFCLVVHAAP